MLKSLLTVSFATLLSRLSGFMRDMLLAFVLGANAIADAFIFAFRLPNLVRRIYTEGALNAAFIPQFKQIEKEEGQDKALEFSYLFLFLLMALILAVSIALYFIIPLFLKYIIQLKDGTLEMTIFLTRLTLPFLALSTLAACFAVILNAFNRYTAAAFSALFLNLFLIATLIFFIFNKKFDAYSAAIILSGTITLSALLQTAFLYFYVRKAKIKLKIVYFELNTHLKSAFKLAIPALLLSSITQINLLIITLFASNEPAAISWLYYAERLYQLPLGIVGVALGIVLLTNITQDVQQNRRQELSDTLNSAITLSFLLTFPASIGLIFGAERIVTVLFERGAFVANDKIETAILLQFLSLSLPFAILIKILSNVYFARESLAKPMFVAILVTVLNVILSFLLFTRFKTAGLSLSFTVSISIFALFLWKELSQEKLIKITREIIKITIAALLMGGILYFLPKLTSPILDLLAFIIIGIGTYSLFIFTFNAFPLEIIAALKQKAKQE